MESPGALARVQRRRVPTVGGLLLFGKDPVSTFPDAWLQCGRFAGDTKADIVDHTELRQPLPCLVEAGMDFVRKHAMRGMVDLKPGSYVLKREAGVSEEDIVESVRFKTQDNLVPEVGTPGELEVEFRDDGTDRYWYYQFRKAYTQDGQEYNLEVRVPVRRVTGGWPEEVVMDSEFMTWNVEAKALIGPGVNPDQIQYFDPCQLASAPRICTMTGADGTVTEREKREIADIRRRAAVVESRRGQRPRPPRTSHLGARS